MAIDTPKTDTSEPSVVAGVTVSWTDDGRLHIMTEGAGLTPDQLILAAYHLSRTAGQLLDRVAAGAEPGRGIERVAAIPAHLRKVD